MTEDARVARISVGPLRFVVRPSKAPTGLILGLCAAAAGLLGRLLRVDSFKVTLCGFKAMTGIPCPTCGATRCLISVARLDLRTAFEMNPLIFVLGVFLAAWAVTDSILWVRRRSLGLEVQKGWGIPIAIFAAVMAFVNWVHLILVGR
jgi:hypothetical protein